MIAATKMVALLVGAVACAGCGASQGSGLSNARATLHAQSDAGTRSREATVLGNRAALSDPREQAAAAAAPARDERRPRVVDEVPARTETPQRAAEPRSRSTHETVDTGRAKVLAEARRGDMPGEADVRPRADGQAQPRAKSPSGPSQASGKSRPTGSGDGNVIEVAAGDTLLQIANRHRVSVASLMAANSLSSLDVQPGQKLVIPKR
jgi:LysM repeat protein